MLSMPSPLHLGRAWAVLQALKAEARIPLFISLLGFDPSITLPMLTQWAVDNRGKA